MEPFRCIGLCSALSFCQCTLVTDKLLSVERTCTQTNLTSAASPTIGIPLGLYNSFNFVVYPVAISPYTSFSFHLTRASAESV